VSNAQRQRLNHVVIFPRPMMSQRPRVSFEMCLRYAIHKTTLYHSPFSMASVFLRPMLRPHALGIGLGLTLATLAHQQRPLKCESSAIPSYNSRNTYLQRSALQDRNLSSNTARQISSGSIIGMFSPTLIATAEHTLTINITGLCVGLAVSTFSRPLALLIGLLVVGVQVRLSLSIPNSSLIVSFPSVGSKSGHNYTAI
jgi:hypothetical protein